jgi:flagellar motility protein MotE (MotC chaperone)
MKETQISKLGSGSVFLLGELLKARVVHAKTGKKIGRIKDLIIEEAGPIPHVTTLVVRRPGGWPDLLVAVDLMETLDKGRVSLVIGKVEDHEKPLPQGALLLKDFVLDKKVIDTEDREVSVVFDVKLLRIDATRKIYVTDVEFGKRGFYRRLGLGWLANLLDVEEDFVSWSYIQALPASIGSFTGNVKIKALKEQIEDMPPVDLADIIEELEPGQREVVFRQLDSEEASDALEEIDPNVQRQIISTMDGEKAAALIDQMTPPQAADVLAVIAHDEKQKILGRLGPQLREKITAILEKQEDSILNYATDRYLSLPADTTVAYVEDNFPELAREKDVATYVYVTGREGETVGVVDLKDLLMAENSFLLGEIMNDNLVSLEPGETLHDAYELFLRYGFRAVPILDEAKRNRGVIVYKDVMGLKHRFVN